MNEISKGAWANAKSNGDFILVETFSGYTSSMRDPIGKQHFLAPDANDEELGFAVLDALAHSRFVLPAPRTDVWIHPEASFDMELYDYRQTAARYAAWTNDLMARYGYKTKRALFKTMKSCSIESKGGVVTISPSHHEKLEGWGREHDDGIEDVVIPADNTPSEIGAALRLAFDRCTG
jgi:hypothetical protein